MFIPTQKVIQTMTIATFLCVRTQKIFLTYIFYFDDRSHFSWFSDVDNDKLVQSFFSIGKIAS